MGSIVKAQVHGPQLGMEAAKLTKSWNDPNVSHEERARQMDKVLGISGEVLSGPEKVKAEKRNATPYYKLEDELTVLASKGFIDESDFGSSKPHWVNRGFKAVKSVKPVCSN
jgi:hypothetical protein